MGEVYKSRIFDVRHYGLMVELVPSGTKVLLHSSNIAHGGFVDPSQAGYKVGDEIEVKYLGKDAKTGKKLISRKVLLDPPPPPPKKDPKVRGYCPLSSLLSVIMCYWWYWLKYLRIHVALTSIAILA